MTSPKAGIIIAFKPRGHCLCPNSYHCSARAETEGEVHSHPERSLLSEYCSVSKQTFPTLSPIAVLSLSSSPSPLVAPWYPQVSGQDWTCFMSFPAVLAPMSLYSCSSPHCTFNHLTLHALRVLLFLLTVCLSALNRAYSHEGKNHVFVPFSSPPFSSPLPAASTQSPGDSK